MLSREQERQVEVWLIMQPYAMPDLEEIAFQKLTALKARRRAKYRDMRAFDPWAYRQLIERARERRELMPRAWRKLRPSDVREALRMYKAGAPIKAIAIAFGVGKRSVLKHISRLSGGQRERGEKIRPARGEAHARWKRTPAMVSAILSASGSCRRIARELGVTHSFVSAVRKTG